MADPQNYILPTQSITLSGENANRVSNLTLQNTLDPNWVITEVKDIDGKRWNKSYPYQLSIVEDNGDNSFPIHDGMVFTLPIGPQEYAVQMPFAITNSVTAGGIAEEHNGAPIRNISLRGTFGVKPNRINESGATLANLSIPQTIFGGTLLAVNSTVSSFSATAGKVPVNTNNLININDIDTTTGYYQFRLLQHFLEGYAAIKKTKDGRNLRLCLSVWKDQASYLVTPMVFEVRKSVESPLEYTYSLQFKAWKKIKVDTTSSNLNVNLIRVSDPNVLKALLDRLQPARNTILNAQKVLQGVAQDVDAKLDLIRQVAFGIKDTLSLDATLLDLPVNLIQDFKNVVRESAQAIKDGIVERSIASEKLTAILNDSATATTQIETLHGAVINHGIISRQNVANTSADPLNKLFENITDNHDVFSLINLADLKITPVLSDKIDTERTRVKDLKRSDYEQMRDELVEFAATYADYIGAGAAVYDTTYDRPTSNSKTNRQPTVDDFEVLFALQETITVLNHLAATTDSENGGVGEVTTLEYIAGLASKSGIAFTVPVSKFAIPFPYGATLEQLALQYLGDANRWEEIAILNGLRAPYVDEVGFDTPILITGSKDKVTVSGSLSFYIGQPVWLSASNVARTKRHIIAIKVIGNGAYAELTLDGDANLNLYSPIADATLHAFLADTVNSQQLIYIPSPIEPDEDDFKTKSIPGLNEMDDMIRVGGVDLLLTSSNDLIITSDGDCRLSVGLTNLIQRLRIGLSTIKGSLLQHPTYGASVEVGSNIADMSAQEIYSSIQSLVANDSKYTGISNLSVAKSTNAVVINLSVGISGVNQNIPLSFEVRK